MKRLLSYLFPVTLKKYNSKFNGKLEINLMHGKKMLDTPTTNYSYGALQQILHKGLTAVGFNANVRSVLVLGMGGGSIVPTIRNDFRSDTFIQLVDIDPDIIAIAKSEFGIMAYGNIAIAQADAAAYMATCKKGYDLIVVDLFIIDTIPEVFTQPKFIADVCACLNPTGRVVFNTMRKTMPAGVLERIKAAFVGEGLGVRVLENVVYTNDLIVGWKGLRGSELVKFINSVI